MMNQIFYEYCLFFIKILTILIILFILLYIFFNANRNSSNILISNVNTKYLYFQKVLYQNVYKKNDKRKKIREVFFNYKYVCSKANKMFIINFDGDVQAKQIFLIRQVVSTIILVANKNDEVLLKLNSSGGFVNNYGLAASEFERLRKADIKLTVAIDLIAASGGFLIASVANKIIAAEFAIIGSIGVLGVVPNFHKFLNKKNIDIEHHFTGEYKTMLSLIARNTLKGRNKFIESLNQTHNIFKNFIKKYRKNLDIERVASGEFWYGCNALNINLVDKIQTSEEFILEHMTYFDMYEVSLTWNVVHSKVNFFKNI